MGQRPVKVTIRTDRHEAQRVMHAIMDEVQRAGYSDNAQFAIRLALDEALSNAIYHGNRNDATKIIRVEYHVTARQVRIVIEDEGVGFRPDLVPDPTLDENLERPNGRGVMLMKAYMTEVDFGPGGNRVTLVKQRNCMLPLVPH